MYKSISSFEAKELINNGAKVIDIRDKFSFERNHIPNSLNISMNNLNTLPCNKDDTLIVVCYSGCTSVSACNLLINMGFQNVYNLLGGYNNFK